METRTSAIAALLFSIAAVADPSGPAPIGNKANTLLAQVNAGSRSMAATGFEENKGQVRTTDGELAPFVRYRLNQGNTSIFLLGNGIAYQFNRTHYPEGFLDLEKDRSHDPEEQKLLDALREEVRLETYRMDMVLEGADPHARISAEGRSADYTNYYNYDALDVRSYARITYHDAYPGIDWVVYTMEQGTGAPSGMKYDFVVHPGADPSRIQLRFKDHEELRLDEEGRLIHGNRMGCFTEEKPVSFQNGKEVSTRFQLNGDLLTFALDNYDPTRTLTIDPARIWGTYYGGTENDYGRSCAVDPDGNVYLSGETNSTSGIASGGHQNTGGGWSDAYLVKFDAAGARLWATYYGGALKFDYGYSCAVDPSGNVYMAGHTTSSSGIASGGHDNSLGGSTDGYLVKFDPAGIRLWGTYYGGGGNDYGKSCAVDPDGNVYLAGETFSSVGIAANGHQNTYAGGDYMEGDAFLVKFDPAGTRLWGTYYGGTDGDIGEACTVDPGGNVYLAGRTTSSSGIASGGHQNTIGGSNEAFLVKFDPAGTRLWGTYYGETGDDRGESCAVDPSGNVYLAGWTTSLSGIASGGHQNTFEGFRDAFLVKFDPDGSRLWGTYYGGTDYDYGYSCAVDTSGNVYLAGQTRSTSGIAIGGHQNTHGGGSTDAFLVKFDAAGTRLWGSYYGGNDFDEGYSCVPDLSGNVYLTGYTNSTSDIASGGHQDTLGGTSDAFLVKFQRDIVTGIPPYGGIGIATTAFPNPSNGLLTVTTTRCGQRYTVCDVAGRPVLEGVLSAQDNQVDLTSQPAGVYLLTVFGTAGNEVVRVVKQ
jgi:hypothetical protein